MGRREKRWSFFVLPMVTQVIIRSLALSGNIQRSKHSSEPQCCTHWRLFCTSIRRESRSLAQEFWLLNYCNFLTSWLSTPLVVDDHLNPQLQTRSSTQARISAKLNDEYASIKDKPAPVPSKEAAAAPPQAADTRRPSGAPPPSDAAVPSTSGAKAHPPAAGAGGAPGNELVVHQAAAPDVPRAPANTALSTLGSKDQFSAQVLKRLPSKWPKPVWHPPWKLYRVRLTNDTEVQLTCDI